LTDAAAREEIGMPPRCGNRILDSLLNARPSSAESQSRYHFVDHLIVGS